MMLALVATLLFGLLVGVSLGGIAVLAMAISIMESNHPVWRRKAAPQALIPQGHRFIDLRKGEGG